jgi:uncharacterized membrane protein
MSLTPDWAPNIHPLIVHFPIALFSAAFVTDLVSLFFRRRAGIRDAATWLYCAGSATAILAYFTGESAADGMLLAAQVTPLVNEHADWAFRTTWFFAFFASVRLAVSFIIPPKLAVLGTTFVFAIAGMGMLFETAEHGAMLVYQHGLGVQTITIDAPIENVVVDSANAEGDSGPIDLGNGSWVWRPVQGADMVLADQFEWLQNNAAQLSPDMADDQEKGMVLGLYPRGVPSLFVAGSDLAATQADVYVNIDEFDGELQLVFHVQDVETFDFLSIDNTAVKLGRMDGGVSNIFEEKPLAESGWLFLRVFGGDGHFRGYVNGELLNHGHADDLAPGPFGLRVNGTGTILIERIQVQNIT